MSNRELLVQELEKLSEQDVEKMLVFLRQLSDEQAESLLPAIAAESALAQDWLSPEEDAAWANL